MLNSIEEYTKSRIQVCRVTLKRFYRQLCIDFDHISSPIVQITIFVHSMKIDEKTKKIRRLREIYSSYLIIVIILRI